MPLPTFVTVGAQKCGTSTLHRMLREHPQIHMSKAKELHFFDRNFDRGLSWYSEQFAPRRQHVQVGETTPIYMYNNMARQRLIETLPDVKIVVILRNPVDRAYSHYWHEVRLYEGAPDTRRKPASRFEVALAAERPDEFRGLASPEELTFEQQRPGKRAYVGRGEFLGQLEVFEKAYGRDRLHVMLLEDLVADREGALRGLFEFLHVTTDPAAGIRDVKANTYRRRDESGKTRAATYEPMHPQTRAALADYFAPHNARLGRSLDRDLSHWR